MAEQTLDACGCCGSHAEPTALDPPPGLSALPFRSGTQATVLRRMLAALAAELPELTAQDTSDPAVALLDAWATVADVVTFYQERILNEGFLRTATERRSVLELARAIGYELRPGVAAATDLVVTVETVAGAPTSAVVPERTKVMSIPGQGQRSQTFETTSALHAVASLNEVGLRLWRPQQVGPGRTSLYLAGLTTGLRPGDAVLIIRPDPGGDQREHRVLRTVAPLPAAGPDQPSATLVGWDGALGAGPTLLGEAVQFQALRLRASIFGQNSPDFRTMPDVVRNRYLAAKPALETPAPTASPQPAATAADADPGHWPGFGLPGAEDDPVIDLDAAYPAVAPGSWLVLTQSGRQPGVYSVTTAQLAAGEDFGITARTTRVTLDRAAGLAGFDRREAVVSTQSERLPLTGEPIPEPVAGKELELDRPAPFADRAAVVVTGEDGAGSPVVRTLAVADVAGATIQLDAALPALDRDSVRVRGNVVPATHGETVEDEVLGSGDGTATHQRFTLRKPDLTHVSAGTASGVVSTLEVRVDGVLWSQVPSLFVAGPQDRVYVVRIDDESRATVVFGDGERGSRLPTGQENVRARYRSGIGPDGEVPAGSLSLLPQRPLGISSVTNPAPATGGVAPERLDDARVNAPLTVLTLDRVVSVRDHEDFARAFAGIAKARATALWVGRRLLVHLTVAGAQGAVVAPQTIGDLRDAIASLGGDPDGMRVDSLRPQPFRVGAALLTDPARLRSDVEDAVRAALRAAYAVDRRQFGQPVPAAEVVTVLQSVPGVVAAVLTALHRKDDAAAVQEVLVAYEARFVPTAEEPDRVLPAELLTLDADRIALTEMAP